MRHRFFSSLSTTGFHRVHYTEWGDADNPRVLICAHGLTRCGRDFDTLAKSLQHHYRVICPDVAGRGESAWLDNKSDYNYPQYINDMLLASYAKTPITRMVINDVGSFIPKASLERISTYLGASPRFADFESIVMAVRAVSPFGEMSDETWCELTVPLVKQQADGSWQFRYDPGIGDAFKIGAIADIDLSKNQYVSKKYSDSNLPSNLCWRYYLCQ